MNVRRSGELVGAAVLVAALLITAIIALIDVNSGPAAAPRPAAQRTAAPAAPTTGPSPSTSPSSSPVAQTSPAAPTPTGGVTYRVKRGDNLTVIARWFKLRGYGALYERNRAIIGNDPDLIVPGQRITISPSGVRMSR